MHRRNKKTGGRYIDVSLVYSRMKRFIFLSTLFLIIAEGCCNHSSCRVPSRIDDLAIALSQNNRNFVTDSICEGIYSKRAREYEQY